MAGAGAEAAAKAAREEAMVRDLMEDRAGRPAMADAKNVPKTAVIKAA